MYEIKFLPRAEKEIKKIKDKKLKGKIKDALIKLSENPYIGQAKNVEERLTQEVRGAFLGGKEYNNTGQRKHE